MSKVLIAGGGAAGMYAAVTAAALGHKVELFEKTYDIRLEVTCKDIRKELEPYSCICTADLRLRWIMRRMPADCFT